MSSERRILGACEDLVAALGVVLRWIKHMEDENLIATVQRIDKGVERLNGSVASHEEQLRQQQVTNATTAMLIASLKDEQAKIIERFDKMVSQFTWMFRVVLGAVALELLSLLWTK